MSVQSSMPPLQQATQQVQAAAQKAQAAAVQHARDAGDSVLSLCKMYSLQAQAAAQKAQVAAVQHASDALAITTTTLHKALLACQRVLKEGCACTRRSKAREPEAGLYSEETDALPTPKSEPPSANKAAADEDDLGPIGRARKSVFGFFAMPKLREEVLAKRPDLPVHEAAHAAADEDEPTTPVGRARNSVFEMFAMPNLRSEVAAKVTHEAKATEADGDRHSDGMVRMGTQRKSIFEMFAIDMPSLRGKVAAKKTQPAKRTRADKNSVYSGARANAKRPTPALAFTLPLTLTLTGPPLNPEHKPSLALSPSPSL